MFYILKFEISFHSFVPIFLEDDNNPFHRLVRELIFFEMNFETALSIPAPNSKQSKTGVMSALSSVTGLISACFAR